MNAHDEAGVEPAHSGVANHHSRRFAPDRITDLSCSDPAELGVLVRDWNCEFLRLERGVFRSGGAMVPLGRMLLGKLTLDRSALHRMQSPLGATSFVMQGPGTMAAFVKGHDLATGACIVMSAASSVELVTRGNAVGYSLSVSDDILSLAAAWLGDAAASGARLLAPEEPRVTTLIHAIDSAVDALTAHPEALARPAVVASIEDHLLATLCSTGLDSSASVIEQRDRARRRIAVERARDYIRQNLSEPIRLSDLCRHAHLQARSLEYGFRETVGVSPVSYVKMLRLGDVRRRLLSAASLSRSISEVALDAGFWHLSQFSVDYKRLFMESPSATRLRTATARGARCNPTYETPQVAALAI